MYIYLILLRIFLPSYSSTVSISMILSSGSLFPEGHVDYVYILNLLHTDTISIETCQVSWVLLILREDLIRNVHPLEQNRKIIPNHLFYFESYSWKSMILVNGSTIVISFWLLFSCRKMWGYGGYDKELSETTAEAAFKKSLECGVKLIDTAAVYGEGSSMIHRSFMLHLVLIFLHAHLHSYIHIYTRSHAYAHVWQR
jgi:hypothetical protein